VTALYRLGKRKAPHTGEVVCGAEEANTGEDCSQSWGCLLESYLETLVVEIAASCARASRASMGAKLIVPRRRPRTSIPASPGRVLATPWALGRISVTVDLAITM
jgi:hypothetical protein